VVSLVNLELMEREFACAVEWMSCRSEGFEPLLF
jgi:hypothetical protein